MKTTSLATTASRLAALAILCGISGTAMAAATFFGPSPYLAGPASPFAGMSFEYWHLEDFEDHLLNVPGVSFVAGPGAGVTSVVFGPAIHDSVDADDGAIDGSGLNGDSFFTQAGATGIFFNFSRETLGTLPTHVGIVWTDGAGEVLFQAFDPEGALLGSIGPTSVPGVFPDGSLSGETAEDRFFGVADDGGISSVFISNNGGGMEVDHLQYGSASLRIDVTGGTITLSWPQALGRAAVESTPALPGGWTLALEEPSLVGQRYVVTADLQGEIRFYRLSK
jgi:hypothetical protein